MSGGIPITVLNVAEKPSVARALAAVFASCPGARERRGGGNPPLFETENVQFPFILNQGQGILLPNHTPTSGHVMITTAVRGHIATQDFGSQYGWNSCNPQDLFNAPIETSYRADMIQLEKFIEEQARRAQAVILWLDCDREGEAISDEVRTICLKGNARLRLDHIYRAKFSTVLPQEIQRALRSLGRINENFVKAVQLRCELDLRVGAAFTRFQTLRIQKRFQEFSDVVISYGPCQFPTLGFVVERWACIETFIPEEFWVLEMSIRLNDENVNLQSAGTITNFNRSIHLKWKRERLYDRVLTTALFENCLEAEEGFVIGMDGRQKNKWRPVPLATVELQKRASRYLRISSENLMSAAEALYQQGYISYPRTETERFRPEFEHIPLIQSFQGVPGFGEFAMKLLNDNGFQNPRAGPHDDNAHPPITPCRAVDPSTILDATQRNVYTLIVKHYLACCSRDAIGQETTLTVRLASEYFQATGLMIIERNWLEIYTPWEQWSTGQGELPFVEVGTKIRPSSLTMREGRTTPPFPITEVELITLMDKNGIGTDATIATHITTIIDREYVEKDGQQRFNPTKLGIALVEGYNSMGYQLNKPDLRRRTEAECNAVANGIKTMEEVKAQILATMEACFTTACAEAHKLDAAVARHFTRLGTNVDALPILMLNFSICGTCNRSMALRQVQQRNQNSKILTCSSCSFACRLPPRGIPIALTDRNNVPQACPICIFQVVKITEGDGYDGKGYTFCPKCFTDPPAEHGGALFNDFQCFKCIHPSCALAGGIRGGDIEIYPCPFCIQFETTGKIFLKKSNKGFMLSCSQRSCEYCVWLPKAASLITIPGEGDEMLNPNCVCSNCSKPNHLVRKLTFTWKSGSVPPLWEREATACILCDEIFKDELFEITLPKIDSVSINRPTNQNITGRARGRGRSSDNVAGRGRGRGNQTNHGGKTNGPARNAQNVCFKCNRPGHFASACPERR